MPRMDKFVGVGKAIFMSVTEVMVVADVDMVVVCVLRILLALSETTERDDAK